MGAFVLAWLVGESIIVYRSVKTQGGPPWPGQLLAGSGAFAALAILAEAGNDARRVALMVAWGLNAAGFLALFPQNTTTATAPNWANALTGTNPRVAGWWDVVKTNPISDNSVLPGASGCGGVGGSASAPGSSGSGGTDISGAQGFISGVKGIQNQTYPGGCPPGHMRMPDGTCVQVAG